MKEISLDEFINSSIQANKKIQKVLSNSFDLKEGIKEGFGGDISTKADLVCEEIFFEYLLKYANIISEESGVKKDFSSSYTVILDPLDGSDNFLSNFPYFGTSISLQKENKVIAGIITNLSNGDIFIKTEDFFKKGSLFSNNFKKVTKNNFSKIGLFEKGYTSKYAQILRKEGIKYRVPGAFALSLAYAHEVLFVLFDGKIREFDISAGRFMCEDLYIFEKDDLFLVSKDENTFKKLRDLI